MNSVPLEAADIQSDSAEPQITNEDRSWWAFRKVVRPNFPVINNDWAREPTDLFILNRLQQAKLEPTVRAVRATLIRRLSFDVCGLPPLADDIVEFENDDSPDAYSKQVDRMLASPSFGERWAQHWLDLARFAETDGFEHDKTRPNAWRYRDWVIASLNKDLPFAEFVRLQLAGDLIAPQDPDALIATGFLLAGPDMPDINLREERLHNFLNEMTGTVGSAFLGLQLGCAQCHDHKTDPISQRDFYRFRSHFENTDVFAEKPFPKGRGQKARYLRRLQTTAPSYLRIKGDFRRKGEQVRPAALRIADLVDKHSVTTFRAKQPRRELAEWLSANPMTHRTIVNRIWQHHFGRGVVDTPSDFGYGGTEPTHPDLLNWLASELPAVGGSLKTLHRRLLNSATYQQSSTAGTNVVDPDNDLLWKMNRRRLEGEAIRDAMLQVSNRLNRTAGGQGIRPPLPKEITTTLLKNQWPVSKNAADHVRRSIYIFARRNLRYPIFDVFDKPDGNASCARRNESVTAPQSLTLFNSEFSLECAKRLASEHRSFDDQSFANAVFVACLGRRPNDSEQRLSREFLSEGDRVTFCLAMFNLNEFIYVD